MPNIASILKLEIARLARKEIKGETEALKKAVAASRAEILGLRRRVSELERQVKQVSRSANARQPIHAGSDPADDKDGGLRFRAAGMASNRKRLSLSAADFGLLVGASGQSVYAWEAGKSKPSAASLSAIAALRGLGKREAQGRLAALRAGN